MNRLDTSPLPKWLRIPLRVAAVLLFIASFAGADTPAGEEEKGAGEAAEGLQEALKESAPPETPEAEVKATVSAEARAEMERIRDAYGKLTSLDLGGTIKAEFDIAGQRETHDATFTSSFRAPSKFRHEVKDDLVVGSTGDKLYMYQPAANAYLLLDTPEKANDDGQPEADAAAPAGRFDPKKMPEPIPQLLDQQNPSLMLALAADASAHLADGIAKIETGPDAKLDGQSFRALRFTAPDESVIDMLVDPQTHLVRRVSVDLRKSIERDGQPDVKTANVTYDYSTVKPGAETNDGQFAWSPPQGARDLAQMASAEAGEGDYPAMKLAGQAAPDFSLDDLDGNKVSLADLKGSVVVLDFWATWCGPCVASLPGLDKIYQANKEKGVKVYAVNLAEEKVVVRAFVEKTKLGIPVLLDTDGKVGEAYSAQAIPQTVVIGKDGKVVKVFIGGGHDEELSAAIADALKQ